MPALEREAVRVVARGTDHEPLAPGPIHWEKLSNGITRYRSTTQGANNTVYCSLWWVDEQGEFHMERNSYDLAETRDIAKLILHFITGE